MMNSAYDSDVAGTFHKFSVNLRERSGPSTRQGLESLDLRLDLDLDLRVLE